MTDIATPLEIAPGLVLANRLAKAAMTENLADGFNCATPEHVRLYSAWAGSGAGLLITGNVLVDRRYLEAPANIAIEPGISPQERAALAAMAGAAKSGGAAVFMQVSHAGRQSPKIVCDRPVAPSAVAMDMPGRRLYPFAPPRAMTAEEVEDAVERFAFAAQVARETGFDGVQIHAAHGYLISQFLSPLANQRNDEWGGDFDRRLLFLRRVIERSRALAGADFPLAVKLNAADFQKGGFSHEGCLRVVDHLNACGLAFLEVSGGTYEQPRMIGTRGKAVSVDAQGLPASTVSREAYFVEYAKSVRARARMPVMATGGFRTREGMDAALATGRCDLIGVARPMCADPAAPLRLLSGEADALPAHERRLVMSGWTPLSPRSGSVMVRTLHAWGQQGWFCHQIVRLGAGKAPQVKLGVLGGLMRMQSASKRAARARAKARRALAAGPQKKGKPRRSSDLRQD